MAKRLGWYLPEQLVLKITLAGSEPKIWRRVEVHSGLTLHDLHFVIQNVFEWEDSHLYHFLVPPGGKLTQKAMRDATRYHVMPPDPIFGFDQKDDGAADEVLLGQIFNDGHNPIVYEYDFGDSWEHIISWKNERAAVIRTMCRSVSLVKTPGRWTTWAGFSVTTSGSSHYATKPAICMRMQ